MEVEMRDSHSGRSIAWSLVFGVALLLSGCGGSAGSSRPTGSAPSAPSGQRAGPTRVIAAIGAELNNLATKLEGGNTYASEFNFMSNSPLVLLDPRGAPSPFMAAELPSRDNGTWT